jgi:hypothetical protein
MVPVDIARNRISWKSVFGDGREAESANMTALHSELLEQVNQKWGLERGSNMERLGRVTAPPKSTSVNWCPRCATWRQLRQGLLRQIRRAEIKLKGISTMIANLRERKQAIQDEIDEIARQFGQDGCDNAALASRMAALRSEMEASREKLSLRQQMLEDAERTILAARARLAALKQEHAEIREHLGTDFNHQTTELQKNLLATYNDMVASSWEPVRPTLTEQQRRISTSPASPTSPTMQLVSSTVPCFSLSTASVRPLPTPSPMVAAPSITKAGDVTRMRTMSSGGVAASPAQ